MMKQLSYEEARLEYAKQNYLKSKKKYERALKHFPKNVSSTSEAALKLDKITEEYVYNRDIYFMLLVKVYIPNSYQEFEDRFLSEYPNLDF